MGGGVGIARTECSNDVGVCKRAVARASEVRRVYRELNVGYVEAYQADRADLAISPINVSVRDSLSSSLSYS